MECDKEKTVEQGKEGGRERGRRLWRQILPGFATLALAIVFFFFLYSFDSLLGKIGRMATILIPFIYGGVMAYMLRMPCNFFEKYLNKCLPKKLRRWSEGLAVFLSLLSFFLILYLLVSMVVPQMAASIAAIVAELPSAGAKATKWLETAMADNPIMENYLQTAIEAVNTKFQTWAQTDLLPMLTNVVDGFASTVSTVVTVLFNLFIGVVVSIYTLGSRKQFARQSKAVLYSIFKPKWAGYILEELNYADKMFVGFFSGKILERHADQRDRWRDQYHSLFRSLHRRGSLRSADPYRGSREVCLVHCVHHCSAAVRREYTGSPSFGKQHRAFGLLGSLFRHRVQRAFRLCGDSGGSAGICGDL